MLGEKKMLEQRLISLRHPAAGRLKAQADLNTLSCDAFIKAPNGGWGLAGTIIVRSFSNAVLSGNTYVKGNAVADIIEKRCGNPFDPPR
jgi:hypothetical protein